VVCGGGVVTGAADVVVGTGAGAAGFDGVCDGEAVPLTGVGLRAVVVLGGAVLVAAAMITTTPTAAVTMLRSRTDQSRRNQSRTKPTGKKKIKKSTTETVRWCHG
jgi:hypothetical protein